MVWLRDLVYGLGLLVTSPYWLWVLLRMGKYRGALTARLGCGEDLPRCDRRRLLFHAVSVGEVSAIRLLIEELHNGPDAPDIVIATTTDTGFARAMQLYGEHHTVVRYPIDFSFAIRRFLNRIRPDAVAMVELEVWPNFVAACARRKIPLCVVNGRLSARSFERYKLIRPLVRSSFARLTVAAVQTQDYAQRFVALGTPADRVRVLDTMKWDTAELADQVEGADALASHLGLDQSRPLVVAGSTGPDEELLIVASLKAHCPQARVLLVPRKPERFDEVARSFPGIRRYSEPSTDPAGDLLLLDVMGQLRKAYALADVVLVGRSFVRHGGSDPMEPVALGKPCVIGPHTANFTDAVTALAEGGGLVVTDNPGTAVAALLNDPDKRRALAEGGRAVIRSRQGATHRHADLLRELLGRMR